MKEYRNEMVRMTVLASGSRGNCTVVTAGRTSVLVDAGVSCREILKRMQMAGEDPSKLDAILITHEHQDHVQGLSVLARRLGIPVYFTSATHRAWMRWMVPQKRMTYADWLATRKAEMAAKAEAAQLAKIAGHAVGAGAAKSGASGPGTSEPGSAGSTFAATNAAESCAAESGFAESAAVPSPSQAECGAETAETANPFYREAELAECAAEQEAFARELSLQAAAHAKSQAAPDPDSGVACEPASAPVPPVDPCALPGVEFFEAGQAFALGDLRVTPFTIPHDAVDPVGFVLEGEGMRIGLATDLGYMPPNVAYQLRGCDVVMLESNHDLEMLRDGPYPWSVKQRVLSRVGHLSNAAAADFLEKTYDGQAAYIVLAHLSSSNNLPELARIAAEWALRERMQLLANRLVVAGQNEPTASICL